VRYGVAFEFCDGLRKKEEREGQCLFIGKGFEKKFSWDWRPWDERRF
jgi:hypothetical protein